MALRILAGLAVTLVVLWGVTCATAAAIRPKGVSWKDAARLAPDLVVLVKRLARDRALPRRIRILVWLALAWMISPIDPIPDFIPVLGSADDVVMVYFLLRMIVRRAGREKLEEHWPGSPEGLAILTRMIRLRTDPAATGAAGTARPKPSRADQ